MSDPYERIVFRGRTYDRITARGHEHWENCLGKLCGKPGPVFIETSQGPYSTAVAVSGNTHAESGAEDNRLPPGVTWEMLAIAGRLAGWFASVRDPSQGDWDWHCHGLQYGNARLSEAAEVQMHNWILYDDNGLVGSAKDPMWDPDPLVPFRFPMLPVRLEVVADEFRKSKDWKPRRGVRLIQETLNLKTRSSLIVDGIAGPRTRRALGRWEERNGGDGDGVPGALLWKLGAARFEVV